MASNNPVLSRPEAFQRTGAGEQYGQPGYGQAPYAQQYPQPGYGQAPYAPQYPQPGYGHPGQTQGLMTIEDVITKSGITMGALIAVASAVFFLMPYALLTPALVVTAIVGFVTVLMVSMRRVVSPAAVLAYCVVEGIFIGALSKMFEYMFQPGIVAQAVLGTFVAAGVTLAAYKYFRIRVTNKFRRIVSIATIGLAVMYLLNLVVSLFGVGTGLVAVGPTAGILSWLVSGVAVVLAVSSLIMDFDYIERGVANGAPASESWRAAFGLTVTMVWLYTELLRILSYFRN